MIVKNGKSNALSPRHTSHTRNAGGIVNSDKLLNSAT